MGKAYTYLRCWIAPEQDGQAHHQQEEANREEFRHFWRRRVHAPVPKQFLAHQGTLTAIRETDLQTEKEAFSAVPFKDLAEGTFCYAVYGVNDSEGDEEISTSWGFLAKVIAGTGKRCDCTSLTATT